MENFIEKARKVHRDKYDYSQVVYINNRTKVKIICPIHGEFFQIPHNHCAGKGCRDCFNQNISKTKSGNKENFVSKAILIHGNKYNYSKVEYKNNRTKIVIECPVHGEFAQTPSNHCQFGCAKCGRNDVANRQKRTTEEFIKEAQEKHGDTYQYSKVKYTQCHSQVEIVCELHGSFLQTPNSHLSGRGCPLCKQGEQHPRFGKPSPHSQGYHGKYKGTTFRSLPELFWMFETEIGGVPFVGLDQASTRCKWQVPVFYGGRKHTYCADFYLPETNEIIDIKPEWKEKIEADKLQQGKIEYEKRGYQFRLIYTNTIKTKIALFKKLVMNQTIQLYAPSIKRFEARFGKISV